MQVSVIIVNYKSPQFTIQCIESLYKLTEGVTFEIIVVDNFSQDNSVDLIKSAFSEVKLLPMAENIGYSRANNEGMKIATGDYFLILNNDTIFTENILLPLCRMMEEDKNISASCVGLYYPDGVQQASGFNYVFGGFNMILTLPYLSGMARAVKDVLRISNPHAVQSAGLETIDWISGAFMFVRKSAVEKVGGFDDDFFLFSEEIEWCARLNKTGKIVINHDLSIIHLVGQTIDNQMNADKDNYYPYWQKKGLQLMVSNLLYVRKQYNAFMMLLHVFIYFSEIPVFSLGVLFGKMGSKHPAFTFHQVMGYSKNCFTLLNYVLPIIFNVRKLYKVYP